MDSHLVAAIVASFVSLALEVVPGLSDVWEGFDGKFKSLTVFGMCLGLPLLALAASCVGVDVGFGVSCPAGPQDIFDALLIGASAYAASQIVHANAGQSLALSRQFNRADDKAAG